MQKPYFILLFILCLSFSIIYAQTNVKQKLEQIQQMFQSLELEKKASFLTEEVDKQMDKILLEGKKIQILLNPPFIPSGWKLIGYQDGFWTVQIESDLTYLKYQPSFSYVKPGYWVGEKNKIQEVRKNVFFAIEMGSLSETMLEKLETWDDENNALNEATEFWKKTLISGASSSEKKIIEAWIALIKQRGELLAAERKFFDNLQTIQREKLSVASKLEEDINNYIAAIGLCNEYFDLAKSKKITLHYAKNVTQWSKQWEEQKRKMASLSKLAQQIEQEYNKIQYQGSDIKADELQIVLKKLLESLDTYLAALEKDNLKAYADPKILSRHKETSEHLSREILSSYFEDLRKAYQEWKGQEGISSIDTELNLLKEIGTVLQNKPEIKEKLKGTHYQKDFEEWLKETEKRKEALLNEKDLFVKLDKSHMDYEQTVALEHKITKVEQTLTLCQEYESKFQNKQISGYHQKSVGEWLKNLQERKQLLQKEMDIYSKLKDSWDQYMQSHYPDIESELKAINTIYALAEEYKQNLQYKQITGYYLKDCKQWLEKLEARKILVQGEESVFLRIQSQIQKWETTPQWSSPKDEDYVIDKALEYCQEYTEKLRNNQISSYTNKQVNDYRVRLEGRQKQIESENRLFDPLQQLQLQHRKAKYTDLESEKNALSSLISQYENYLEKAKNKEISEYNRKTVEEWYNVILEQRKALSEEESLYRKVSQLYQAWDKQSSWTDAGMELEYLNKAWEICNLYKAKVLKSDISNYYSQKVFDNIEKLEKRKKIIDNADILFADIKKMRDAINSKTFTDLTEEQKEIQAFLNLCQDHKNKISGGLIAAYHQQDVDGWSNTAAEKDKKLQEIASLYSNVKNSFGVWDSTSHWVDFSAEEDTINKIFQLMEDYENTLKRLSIANYYKAEMSAWLEKLNAQKKRLMAEQQLYEELKNESKKYEKQTFAGMDEEKERLKVLVNLCDDYLQKTNQTTDLTKHYQKSVRSWQRKFKDQQKKLEKEEAMFNQTKSSYMFWKNNSPWPNKKDERRALEQILENIQMYKDSIQMKKMSAHYWPTVEKYEQEIRARIETLNKS